MKTLYGRLREVGVRERFVRSALLPSWWDDEAANSAAGYSEALIYVSKRLGIPLSQLRDSKSLEVTSRGRVKFKLTDGQVPREILVARNLAVHVATQVVAGFKTPYRELPSAAQVRQEILKTAPWVSLENLVAFLWEHGVPVVHVNNFPEGTRKMHGMTVNVDGRPVIVVSKKIQSASWLLFIVAHEAGHAALGHTEPGDVLIDETVDEDIDSDDERAANAYAGTVVCGDSGKTFTARGRISGDTLAREAIALGKRERIDPGHIVLNYAKTMNKSADAFNYFALAQAALKLIEPNANALEFLRAKMLETVDFSTISDESAEFVRVMTGTSARV